MSVTFYHVAAFTDQVIKGNPARGCLLLNPIDEKLMKNMAMEVNSQGDR
jgi:predicted PhzF superfamily epimerase YddE/YHI9